MSTIDERVEYWKRGQGEQNFGDYLSHYIADRAFISPLVDASQFRLIGSSIDAGLIAVDRLIRAATPEAPLVYWGCGARSDVPIAPELLSCCQFLGVRGALTRDIIGLAQDTPIGDPGLILPLLCPASDVTGEAICIPHINDPMQPKALRALSGAQRLILPVVSSIDQLEALLKTISTAEFVLCGSLHAAIIACAYGRPFAFWDTGHIDVPFKWLDFASSIGVDLPFCHDISEGREVYAAIAGRLKKPKLSLILGCCPFAVRPEVWARAFAHDVGAPAEVATAMHDLATRCLVNTASWIDHNSRRLASNREAMRCGTGPFVPPSSLSPTAADPIIKSIRAIADSLSAEVSAARFSFELQPTLKFAASEAGAAMLSGGWSEPNDVGPWAIEKHSTILLPAHSGWWTGSAFILEGYFFAPHASPILGAREISVWLNEIPVGEIVVTSPAGSDTTYASVKFEISNLNLGQIGDAFLRFEPKFALSPRELGVGWDERRISFAPISLTLCKEK